MRRLSMVQEYFLLALKQDGSLPLTERRLPTCILAAGLAELMLSGSISLDKAERIVVRGALAAGLEHLTALFEWLRDQAPVSVEDVAREFSSPIMSRTMARLIQDIGESLEAREAVYGEGSRLAGMRLYVPSSRWVDEVVLRIRREILYPGVISGETALLADLLEKSGRLKKHFYAHEVDELEQRLQEIKKFELPRQWSERWGPLLSDWMAG